MGSCWLHADVVWNGPTHDTVVRSKYVRACRPRCFPDGRACCPNSNRCHEEESRICTAGRVFESANACPRKFGREAPQDLRDFWKVSLQHGDLFEAFVNFRIECAQELVDGPWAHHATEIRRARVHALCQEDEGGAWMQSREHSHDACRASQFFCKEL